MQQPVVYVMSCYLVIVQNLLENVTSSTQLCSNGPEKAWLEILNMHPYGDVGKFCYFSRKMPLFKTLNYRSSVVECLSRDRKVAGSGITVFCP